MLVATNAGFPYVLVDPVRLLPRFWATAWTAGLAGRSHAPNTVKNRLGHLKAFYSLCDERFGRDSLDAAINARDVRILRQMVEVFYLALTSGQRCNSTTVQRWDAVRAFVLYVSRQLG